MQCCPRNMKGCALGKHDCNTEYVQFGMCECVTMTFQVVRFWLGQSCFMQCLGSVWLNMDENCCGYLPYLLSGLRIWMHQAWAWSFRALSMNCSTDWKGEKLTSNDSHDLTLELCHRALDDRACHGNQTNSSWWLEIASPELLNCCQVPISSWWLTTGSCTSLLAWLFHAR